MKEWLRNDRAPRFQKFETIQIWKFEMKTFYIF